MEEGIIFSNDLVFKYGTLDHLKDTIIHNSIGFSKAESFNDPFEIAHELFCSASDETYEKKRKYLQNTEISCFSRTPNEPLMWSHYADKHRGVCYMFKETELIIYGLCSDCGDVTYSNHFPSIHGEHLSTEINFKREFKKVIFTKSLNWAYEKEFRITLNPEKERKFKKRALRGVILGFRAAMEKEKYILNVVNEANKYRDDKIEVFYANLSTQKYEMFISKKPTRTVVENTRYI